MKKFFDWKLLLLLIILLAGFLRLYQLGNIPYGSTGDETAYIYNAYSIWNTGRDVMGNFLPLSFNFHSSESPVPVYLTAPFVGILGLNLFNARLLSAMLGVGSVLVLFLLAQHLFKDKWVGLLSAFLLAISPWALQIDRELWDVNFAKFFYLLGIYIFVKNVKSNKYIYSLIPFALAFYSYHGTKVFFVLLIPVLILFFRKQLLKRKKSLVVFCTLIFFLFVSFLLILKFQGVIRQNEVYLLKDPNTTGVVNAERTKNIAPDIVKKILSNKPLYFLRVIRENYLEAFSTNFLFLYGETDVNTQMESIYFRGVFYIIELPLLLFGLYKLITAKNKLNRNLLLPLLLIAAFPSAITYDRNFVNRDVMMLPILVMIISFGTFSFLKYILKLKKSYKYIALIIFIGTYLFLFT
jgi:4-amino-4-deoxy-L-arabinose transferase-like glycosyltransferase